MDELRSAVESAITEGFRDETLAKVKNQIKTVFDEAQSDFEYWIKADIPYNLARFVEQMADQAITAMLKGDDAEMRRRLSCMEGSYTGRDRDHHVIRGKLFETGALELRKQIIDAHAPLLKEQRILDLEDQLASVVKQFETYRNRVETQRMEEVA